MKFFGTAACLIALAGAIFYRNRQVNLAEIYELPVFKENSCIEIENAMEELVLYKQHDKSQLKEMQGHPAFITRPLSDFEYQVHNEYNFYKVYKKTNTDYFAKNILYPEIQLKISLNQIKGTLVSCPKKTEFKSYVAGECLRQENKLGRMDYFWKVLKVNEDNYEVQGIYDIYLSDLVLKEGMSSPIFKYYNPEASYPLKITKVQFDKLATKVSCPEILGVKFKAEDCFKEQGNSTTYQVSMINEEAGVYEAKIIKEESNKADRSIASISYMEDELVGFQKAKFQYGLRDFFFYNNDNLESVDCPVKKIISPEIEKSDQSK